MLLRAAKSWSRGPRLAQLYATPTIIPVVPTHNCQASRRECPSSLACSISYNSSTKPATTGSNTSIDSPVIPRDKPVEDEVGNRTAPPKWLQSQSVFLPPLLDYNNEKVNQWHRGAYIRRLKQIGIAEKYRTDNHRAIPNWRETLQLLTSLTPQRSEWKENVLKVVLPNRYVGQLSHDVDCNIWDIHQRTGCLFSIHKGITHSTVLLSGDDVAAKMAAGELLQLSKEIRVFPFDGKFSEEAGIPEQVHMTSAYNENPYRNSKPFGVYRLSQRFEDIPRPQVWTKGSFLQYITALTAGRLEHHLTNRFYGSPVARDTVVLNLLHEIFNDQAVQEVISAAAFKQALRFMERPGYSHQPHARLLFTRMLMANFPVDVDVFNIFLAGTVKVTDLGNYHSILRLMARNGCTPNLRTWSLFLSLVESEEAKRHIIKTMYSRGLQNIPRAMEVMARELGVFDLHRAVREGNTMESFYRQMTGRYGENWVTQGLLCNTAKILGDYGMFGECMEFLEIAERTAGVQPKIAVFHAILSTCRLHKSLPDAIKTLQKMEALAMPFDDVILAHLSHIAWGSVPRYPNVLAVVWATTCLRNLTGFPMRAMISRTMENPCYTVGLASGESNDFYATPAVICTELNDAFQAAMAELAPSSPRRHGAIIARLYREKYPDCEPKRNLSELLREAMVLDEKLHAFARQSVSRVEGEGTEVPDLPSPVMEIQLKGKGTFGFVKVHLPIVTKVTVRKRAVGEDLTEAKWWVSRKTKGVSNGGKHSGHKPQDSASQLGEGESAEKMT